MPLQKYQCAVCKKVFEKLIRMNTVKIECPKCSGIQVKKLMPSNSSPFSEMEKMSALNKIAKTKGIGRDVERTWDPKKHQDHS